MRNRLFRPIVLIIIIALGMYGCIYQVDKLNTDVRFDMSLALPLAKGRLNMRSLIPPKKDSTYAIEHYDEANDGDSIIRLIYEQDSAVLIDEFIELPRMIPYRSSYGISDSIIDDFDVDDSVTFERLVFDGYEGQDSIDLLNFADAGATTLVPNPGTGNYFGTKPIEGEFTVGIVDGVQFDYIVLNNGQLVITVNNGYAVPISFTITLYTIQSAGGGFEQLGDPIFVPQVPAGSAGPLPPRDLQNAIISGIMKYEISDVILYAGDASNVIERPDLLKLGMEVYDLSVNSGQAYFFDKLLKLDTLQYFTIIEENGAKQLYEIGIESGFINYDITSEFDAPINVSLDLPSTTRGTDTASFDALVESRGSYTDKWQLGGYTMDLTQNPDQPFNSLPAHLNVSLNTDPNEPLFFNTADSVYVDLYNVDSLHYDYVKGYWGQDTIVVKEETREFGLGDFFPSWKSGDIIFTEPKVTLEYVNPTGIEGVLDLNMTGLKHDKDGVLQNEVTLQREYTIERMQDVTDDPIDSLFVIGPQEINPVFSTLPDELRYSGILYVNRNAGPETINFVKTGANTAMNLTAELPLKLKINDFTLEEEFVFGFDSLDNFSFGELEKLTIYFKVKNQFPLNLSVNAVLLDTTKRVELQPLGTLIDNTLIQSPEVSPVGKVERGVFKEYVEVIEFDVDDGEMLDKIMQANKVLITAVLASPKDNNSVTLYTYYGLDFNIAIDANVTVQSIEED